MSLPADEVAARARRVRLVLTDCDGVLTDTGIYYSVRGEEMKRFSFRDGMGFERLRKSDIAAAIVTGENSDMVTRRAEKLGIRAFLGVKDKSAAAQEIFSEYGVAADEVAFIGDDVNDLGLIQFLDETGLTGAPRDAMPDVVRGVHWVSTVVGGHGAFRDFAEWILSARAEVSAS
ncbi:MAG: HAD family hydrolase [Polyangiaceae bacterium]